MLLVSFDEFGNGFLCSTRLENLESNNRKLTIDKIKKQGKNYKVGCLDLKTILLTLLLVWRIFKKPIGSNLRAT